jgi:hypothetical protein
VFVSVLVVAALVAAFVLFAGQSSYPDKMPLRGLS